jgi:hypothetical protein
MIYPKIKLTSSKGLSQLVPKYDADAGVLVADSIVRRPWPLGIDVNGTLVLDFDASKVLASLELIMNKSMWQLNSNLIFPKSREFVDLELEGESLLIKSFHLPLQVESNKAQSLILISFAKGKLVGDTFNLSDNVLVFCKQESLMGFLMRI